MRVSRKHTAADKTVPAAVYPLSSGEFIIEAGVGVGNRLRVMEFMSPESETLLEERVAADGAD